MARKVAPPENPSGLFYAREHRGLSQDELASASGALKPMISKLESGSRELTRAWAERFAGPLRLSAIRIMFWDKVGSPPAHAEAEYDIPNMPNRPAAPPPSTPRQSERPAPTPRLKPLKSALRKIFVAEWRDFMGVNITTAAAALGLDADSYAVLEAYPASLTGEQLVRLADNFGVEPSQLWFKPPEARPSTHVSAAKRRAHK